jgi:hypothetical protein
MISGMPVQVVKNGTVFNVDAMMESDLILYLFADGRGSMTSSTVAEELHLSPVLTNKLIRTMISQHLLVGDGPREENGVIHFSLSKEGKKRLNRML